MDFQSCSAELDFAPIATKLCVLRRISRNPRRVYMSRSSAEGRNLVMPSSMDVSLTMRKTFLKVCACRGSAYRRRCGPRNAEGDTEGFLEVCRTSQANLYMVIFRLASRVRETHILISEMHNMDFEMHNMDFDPSKMCTRRIFCPRRDAYYGFAKRAF